MLHPDPQHLWHTRRERIFCKQTNPHPDHSRPGGRPARSPRARHLGCCPGRPRLALGHQPGGAGGPRHRRVQSFRVCRRRLAGRSGRDAIPWRRLGVCGAAQTGPSSTSVRTCARARTWWRSGWEAGLWEAERTRRATLIDELCWDEEAGLYREYDFVAGTRVPVATISTLWPLWAGVAHPDRAARVVAGLGRFRHPFGVTSTDRIYPSPPTEWEYLQWQFPAG